MEFYLEKCVDSVLNQSYQNLEILLVDDGSKDSSPIICDNYAERDPRVRVIHKENGGLSSARNAGIDAAKGEVIYFLDSDDYIHPRAFEWLLQNLKENNADISIGAHARVLEDSQMMFDLEKEKAMFCCTGREALANLFGGERRDETVIACGKLYRRSLWDTLRFPAGKYHEDEFVAHYALDFADRVVYTKQALYFYLVRDNSITEEKFSLRRLDAGVAFQDRIEFFRKQGYEDLLSRGIELYLWWILMTYTKILAFEGDQGAVKEELLQNYRAYYRGWRCQVIKKRIKFGAFYMMPNVVSCVWRFMKRDR